MTTSNNPLVAALRIPGETCRLPSGGLFYPPGVLDPSITNGELHVYPMTALDEIVMKSPDKILNGDAVRDVFMRCIPGILQPELLSAKDVDYLLAFIRKVSYGDEFEIRYNHGCSEDSEDHVYKFSIGEHLKSTKSIDPTTMEELFRYEFPGGQVLKLRPASYGDVIKLYQMQLQDTTDLSSTELLDSILTSLLAIIQEVDGITDQTLIREWLHAIPVDWLGKLSDHARDTTRWGIDIQVDAVCKDCGKPIKIGAPFNPINFFI